MGLQFVCEVCPWFYVFYYVLGQKWPNKRVQSIKVCSWLYVFPTGDYTHHSKSKWRPDPANRSELRWSIYSLILGVKCVFQSPICPFRIKGDTLSSYKQLKNSHVEISVFICWKDAFWQIRNMISSLASKFKYFMMRRTCPGKSLLSSSYLTNRMFGYSLYFHHPKFQSNQSCRRPSLYIPTNSGKLPLNFPSISIDRCMW